jgi:hypothetical protein
MPILLERKPEATLSIKYIGHISMSSIGMLLYIVALMPKWY